MMNLLERIGRVLILHNPVTDESAPDEADVLQQIHAISESLMELRLPYACIAFKMNLEEMRNQIREYNPGCVVNLVESVNGRASLLHLAGSLLDSMGLPYTGSKTEALFTTTNKLIAKQIMVGAGINTSPWLTMNGYSPAPLPTEGTFIIKSVWEHASIGLDENALAPAGDAEALVIRMNDLKERFGGKCFGERFIEGREFNLSVLNCGSGPRILPAAEILFENFADGKPHLVDYKAKWDESSFEYMHTVRSFDFSEQDKPLIDALGHIALECWKTFDLGGYGRVDFRVDQDKTPWVLEVNSNPCLSKDAGFAAAAERAGLNYTTVVACILEDALSRRSTCEED